MLHFFLLFPYWVGVLKVQRFEKSWAILTTGYNLIYIYSEKCN